MDLYHEYLCIPLGVLGVKIYEKFNQSSSKKIVKIYKLQKRAIIDIKVYKWTWEKKLGSHLFKILNNLHMLTDLFTFC